MWRVFGELSFKEIGDNFSQNANSISWGRPLNDEKQYLEVIVELENDHYKFPTQNKFLLVDDQGQQPKVLPPCYSCQRKRGK